MEQAEFRETVIPGKTFFLSLVPLPVAIWLVSLPLNVTIGTAVAVGSYLAAMAIATAKSIRISVSKSKLEVSPATIDRKHVVVAKIIDKKDVFAERGSRLDSRAYTRFQIGVKNLVRIEISDPRDPTPYWLISTRKPRELVRALNTD
jgi:hypothetical protein